MLMIPQHNTICSFNIIGPCCIWICVWPLHQHEPQEKSFVHNFNTHRFAVPKLVTFATQFCFTPDQPFIIKRFTCVTSMFDLVLSLCGSFSSWHRQQARLLQPCPHAWISSVNFSQEDAVWSTALDKVPVIHFKLPGV